MKVVLIGAGGFLGSAIFNGLYNEKNQIDWHLFSSSRHLSKELNNLYYHTYRWPLNSLTDALYSKILVDADVIIYAAGSGIQSGEDTDENSIFNLNLFEPVRLVQDLDKKGFRGQLITFGSYFEIGKNQPHQLLSEQKFLEECNPLPNAYCRSKKELSHFHFVYEHVGIDFKWLHLVLTNIYGPGENGNRLIPYIIKQSKLGLPLQFTKGSQLRQYTYIGDIVHVISTLVGKASGFYHVTNEEVISVKMIIEETVLQVKNKLYVNPKHNYDLTERRDTAMDYLAISAQKLLLQWNLSCSTSYQEGIASYFKK